MKAVRLLHTLAAACFAVCMIAGCTATSPSLPRASAGTDARKVLRVGVTPNSPPMIFMDGRRRSGIEADLAYAIGDVLQVPVLFIDVPWENQIDTLLSGKTDIIMSGMSITPYRQTKISFTRPYLRVGQMALIRSADRTRYTGPASILVTQDRVGVEVGTTGASFVSQECRRAKRVNLKSPQDAMDALLDKHIDIFVHDAPVIWWMASNYESEGLLAVPGQLTEEYLAWGYRNDDQEFGRSVDRALTQLEKSGKLDRILSRWIPYGQ